MTLPGEGESDAMRPPSASADTADHPPAHAHAVAAAPDSGVGRSYVGPIGVTVVAGILVAAMTFTVYCLVAVWPTSGTPGVTSSHVAGLALRLDREQRLFVIVALAGALGGLIHSGRSLYEYTGNRILRRSWLLMYLSLPFIGGSLAVVFYLILRGGLVTGTAAQVNFFGFTSISALVGLFSPEAAEKLKQIFSTLLAPPPQGRDRLPHRAVTAAESVEPRSGPVGAAVRVRGQNLSGATAVVFLNARATPTAVSETEVTCVVPPGAATGRMCLVVGDLIIDVPGEFRVTE